MYDLSLILSTVALATGNALFSCFVLFFLSEGVSFVFARKLSQIIMVVFLHFSGCIKGKQLCCGEKCSNRISRLIQIHPVKEGHFAQSSGFILEFPEFLVVACVSNS